VTVRNSTFYNNQANNAGGALYFNNGSASAAVTNCTFVDNSTSLASGGAAIAVSATSHVSVANNIFVNTMMAVEQCNSLGTVTSLGGNLVYPASTHCTINQSTDLVAMVQLGPYRNNGGYPYTIEVLAGSPGIDGAVSSLCPMVDERGNPRLVDGHCDVGAFETAP
jgi:hypothetical protein